MCRWHFSLAKCFLLLTFNKDLVFGCDDISLVFELHLNMNKMKIANVHGMHFWTRKPILHFLNIYFKVMTTQVAFLGFIYKPSAQKSLLSTVHSRSLSLRSMCHINTKEEIKCLFNDIRFLYYMLSIMSRRKSTWCKVKIITVSKHVARLSGAVKFNCTCYSVFMHLSDKSTASCSPRMELSLKI